MTEGMGDSDEEEEGGKKRKRGENWLEDVKEEMKGADEEDRETYKKLLKEKRLKRRKLEVCFIFRFIYLYLSISLFYTCFSLIFPLYFYLY